MPLTLTLLSAAVPAEKRGLALGAWGGIGGLAVALGPLVGGAIVQGISWQWIFWLNVPIGIVLIPLAWRRLDESRGRERRARPPRRRPGQHRPARHRLGPRPRELRRLGKPGDRRRARSAAPHSSPHSWPGSCAPRRRCCRCASSATAPSRRRTSPRCSCSSGCSGRSSCWRSSSRPSRATRRFGAGLRILPWTAMPIFIAPIAGAMSDRIPGPRIMGVGLALQAIGLGWIAAVSTPTVPVRAARRPVPALRHRHGALLRPGRERRALLGDAARGRAGVRSQQRDPRARGRLRRRGARLDLLQLRRLRAPARASSPV